MEKIKIIFLGTGSAIPTITRNHTSIFLKYKDRNMLIDCGEGTQRQIRKAWINPVKITDILITHFHGDHVFGLPGLLSTLSQCSYTGTINIYGPKKSEKSFKKILELADANINIKFNEVRGKFIDNPYFSMTAMPLEHKIPCNGYLFEEKDRIRVDKNKLKKLKINRTELKKISDIVKGKNIKIGKKRINWKDITYIEKGRKVSFIIDTKLCSNAKKLARNSDLAVIEASFLDNEKKAMKYKHLTLEQALKIGKEAKVKKLILTHISQRYEFKENLLLKKAKKIFKNADIASDFMSIEI